MTIERLNYLTVALLDSDIPEACYEDYVDLLELVKAEIEQKGDRKTKRWYKDELSKLQGHRSAEITKLGKANVLYVFREIMHDGDTLSVDGVDYRDGDVREMPFTLSGEGGYSRTIKMPCVVKTITKDDGFCDVYLVERS